MSLRTPLHRRHALAWLAAPCWPAAAHAQAGFARRPIQLLVPFAPGGIADITARTVAQVMAQRLGQPVVVDNRPSAGSIVASQAVASAAPDGHTLLLMSNANAVSVGLFRKLPYDTLKAFAPVSLLGSFDLGVFVAAGSRFTSLQAVLAHARANPGALAVGTIAVGSTQHLAAKLLETLAGVQLLVVPYKGSPAVLNALRAGEVELAIEITGPMQPQLQAGTVRALAVSAARRNPALPAVPTAAEAGLAGFEVASWNGIAAPAGTPDVVVVQLNQAVRAALADAAVQARLAEMGMRAAPSTPVQMQQWLAGEVQRWGRAIHDAKIEPQ